MADVEIMFGGDDSFGDNDYCRNSGDVCGDDGREGDVGNDDNIESNDEGDGDGDGNGDGFKTKLNMNGDVPDIRMFKRLLRHLSILNKTFIERCRNQNDTLISKYKRHLEIVCERNYKKD